MSSNTPLCGYDSCRIPACYPGGVLPAGLAHRSVTVADLTEDDDDEPTLLLPPSMPDELFPTRMTVAERDDESVWLWCPLSQQWYAAPNDGYRHRHVTYVECNDHYVESRLRGTGPVSWLTGTYAIPRDAVEVLESTGDIWYCDDCFDRHAGDSDYDYAMLCGSCAEYREQESYEEEEEDDYYDGSGYRGDHAGTASPCCGTVRLYRNALTEEAHCKCMALRLHLAGVAIVLPKGTTITDLKG